MKLPFVLVLLAAAAASTDAFQPIALPKTSVVALTAVSEDCKQGDMSAECLLSDQELKWFSGKANADRHKSDAQLALELEDAKARIKELEADLAAGKFAAGKQQEDDDCEVHDPRIECQLSDLERKWAKGQAFVENELQASLHLQNLKEKARALAQELRK